MMADSVSDNVLVPVEAPGLHIPALDGLRALAFLLVFIAHDGFMRVVPGGFGVTIFFFLSGYLITTLLRREFDRKASISFGKFYLRRARRILPPLYLSLSLGIVLGALGIASSAGSRIGVLSVLFYFYNYLVLLHSHFNMPSGSGVVWSLMIEEHFYLIFPPIYLVLRRSKLSPVQQGTLLLIACLGALVWRIILVRHFHTAILGDVPFWTYLATDARFDAILWGCILAIASNPFGPGSDRNTGFLSRHESGLFFTGVLLIFATLAFRNAVFRETARYTLQSMALYPIFFYLIHQPQNWVTRLLERPVLRTLGAFSYTMYLTHTLTLDVVHRFVTNNRFSGGLLAYLAAVLLAFLMQRFVEDPLRRWIR